jgi:hypothetical protein
MRENGRWLDFAPREEVDAWLASADAFLVPMVFDPAMRRRMDSLDFQHGYQHLHSGDPAIALRAFTRNLRLRPWRPELWVHAIGALFKLAVQRETTPRAH